MFQDEPALALQEFFFKDEPGKIVDRCKCIRRARKDEIVLLVAGFYVFKHIRFYHFEVFKAQGCAGSLYVIVHIAVLFYDGEITGTPAGHFITDGTGAAEKIQRFQQLNIKVILNDIE